LPRLRADYRISPRLKIPLKKKMGSVVHHINEKWAIPCNLPKFTVFHSNCVELRQWDKLDDKSAGTSSSGELGP
jgi:hypothetical protein